WAWFASAPTDAMTVFGWNTATNQPIGVVANSNLPQNITGGTAGTNGDIAFDRAGNLYVVSNTGTSAALGVIDGPLPTIQPLITPARLNQTLASFSNPANASFNGIAFNAVGDLFIQWSTAAGATMIKKVDPSTGAITAGPSVVDYVPPGGGIGVDLGACSA